jgi:hypothetical protein
MTAVLETASTDERRFGAWQTICHRHNRWAEDETYVRLHEHLMARSHAAGARPVARQEGRLRLPGHPGGTTRFRRANLLIMH